MRAPEMSSPEFKSTVAPTAPLVTGLDTLLPSRPEDKATLESDLSAAPEAEMGWGVITPWPPDLRSSSPHESGNSRTGAEPQRVGVAVMRIRSPPVSGSSIRSYVSFVRESSIRLLEA